MHPVMRTRALLLVALSTVALLPLSAQAGTTQITVGDKFFNPEKVEAAVGSTVNWFSDGTNEKHNVQENSKIFYSGLPTSAPINFKRVFSSGSFNYFCKNHGSKSGDGMAGVVRIPVKVLSDPQGLVFTVRWATEGSNTGTAFDVQYRVGSGSWKTWKNDTSAAAAVFGKADDPVAVGSGEEYSFRARSLKGDAASRWSPIVTYTP